MLMLLVGPSLPPLPGRDVPSLRLFLATLEGQVCPSHSRSGISPSSQLRAITAPDSEPSGSDICAQQPGPPVVSSSLPINPAALIFLDPVPFLSSTARLTPLLD